VIYPNTKLKTCMGEHHLRDPVCNNTLRQAQDLRVLDRATYLVDNQSLIGLVSNRIERFDLIRDTPKKIRTQKRWSVKHKYVFSVVHAVEAGIIIATNTSGAHFGLNESSGELIWSTDPIGNGDSGVMLPDGRFAFASWSGFMQFLNPSTGRPHGRNVQFLTQLRGLQVVEPSGRLIVRQSRLSEPEGRVWQAVSELEITSGALRQISPETTGQDIWVDPNAEFFLSRKILGRFDKIKKKVAPSRFELVRLGDDKPVCSQTYETSEVGLNGPTWTPDGKNIVLTPFQRTHSGFLFLNAQSLKKQFFFPSKDSRSIAFGKVESEAILCGAPNSKIVNLSELPSWSAPQPDVP
jgi:hypothetical protein